jgi:hypothetical protein
MKGSAHLLDVAESGVGEKGSTHLLDEAESSVGVGVSRQGGP